ncbi:hypothetical protein M9H77_13248 [Catharanthus roseus]|uniref:Uncharacterized protein n=1 Tax=Catharanthus roseus TaxID=4058 RepID=A0ACC0BJT0_CATRO|nr:hypothetical protein M9H77_13248 [Catharanthus roseus]
MALYNCHLPSSSDGSHGRNACSKERRGLHLETMSEKIVLQGSNGVIFEEHEAVAKQSIMIKYMIEGSLARHILLPKVPGNILEKVIEYCKYVLTQPPASENDIDLKAFVS